MSQPRRKGLPCPKCGSPWRVKNTRTPKDGESLSYYNNGHLVKRVGKWVSWYTTDYVARQRVCIGCGHKSDTIELSIDDFEELSDYILKTEGNPIKKLIDENKK